MARKILRKSGFVPGGAGGGGPIASTRGKPILSLPPVSGDCPRPPFDNVLDSKTPEYRNQFYATVRLAETGDPGALSAMRDYLIEFGLEDFIVWNGVMPRIRYDWEGDVYTFTLDPTAGCPIEIDIVPHPEAFWDQYKYGDPRFAGKTAFGALVEGQDGRWLTKSILFHSTAVNSHGILNTVNLNQPDNAPFAKCGDPADPQSQHTHIHDGVSIPQSPRIVDIVGYLRTFQPSGVAAPTILCGITTNQMLDNPVTPVIEDVGLGNGPAFGVIGGVTNIARAGTANQFGKRTVGSIFGGLMHGNTYWRICSAPAPNIDATPGTFAYIRSNARIPDSSLTNGTSWEDSRVTKTDPASTHTINWLDNPAPNQTMFRYEHTFETFAVVAVRMANNEVSLTPGAHFHPLGMSDYITVWDVSGATQSRMVGIVETPMPGCVLRPVWATSKESIISGGSEWFAGGVACDAAGYYEGAWGLFPDNATSHDEIHVCFVVVNEAGEVIPHFGLAEVQIRNEGEVEGPPGGGPGGPGPIGEGGGGGGEYPPPPENLPPVEGELPWPEVPGPEPGYPPRPEEEMPYP